MALLKCKECGGTVSDKAAACPHCGAPVEIEDVIIDESIQEEVNRIVPEGNKEKPKSLNKKLFIILAIIVAAIIAVVVVAKVTADKDAPVISGIKSGEVINVTCGTDFNLKNYIAEKIKIIDKKDGEIKEFSVVADKKVYDKKTGMVDTQQVGKFLVKLTAIDKAENQAEAKYTLKLNPVRITKDNRTPLIYDGKHARIQLKSIEHGNFYGKNEYHLVFEYFNKTDNQLDVYLRSSYTYIKDTNIKAYYIVNGGIKPGKKGKSECEIYDEDIPKKLKNFDQIESAVGMGIPDGDCIYTIPVLIDKAAFK